MRFHIRAFYIRAFYIKRALNASFLLVHLRRAVRQVELVARVRGGRKAPPRGRGSAPQDRLGVVQACEERNLDTV